MHTGGGFPPLLSFGILQRSKKKPPKNQKNSTGHGDGPRAKQGAEWRSVIAGRADGMWEVYARDTSHAAVLKLDSASVRRAVPTGVLRKEQNKEAGDCWCSLGSLGRWIKANRHLKKSPCSMYGKALTIAENGKHGSFAWGCGLASGPICDWFFVVV